MSNVAINKYYRELENIIQYGGSKKETSIRSAFYELIQHYCKSHDFIFIEELDYKSSSGKTIYPDGTIKDRSGRKKGTIK